MEAPKLFIKNMVCHRCVLAVEEILNKAKVPFSKVLMGEVLLTKELYKDSRAYFTEFFDKHPKSVESKIKMALCHFNEGNEDYAMVDLNDAIYTFPKRGEAYYYKGRIRITEQDTAAACKLFRKADSLNYRQGNEALYIYCH